jgi:hypothetical protein
MDVQAGTGWHVSELVRFAKMGRVEPYRGEAEGIAGVLVCPQTKSGEPLRTAVSAEVLKAGKRLVERGSFSFEKYCLAIKAACKAAGIPPFTPGRFRHSVATWAIENEADPASVTAFLNHKSPTTTQRFYATHAVRPRFQPWRRTYIVTAVRRHDANMPHAESAPVNLWFVLYSMVGCALALAALDHWVLLPRRLERQFGDARRSYNEKAFHPQIGPPGRDNIRDLVRVAVEVRSTGGKWAVIIEHHEGTGVVVHEFARNGRFSSRGPYFIRLRNSVWSLTGRRHLIKAVLYPYGIGTSNPSGGQTREIAREILEFDTKQYPPVSLRKYSQMNHHSARE